MCSCRIRILSLWELSYDLTSPVCQGRKSSLWALFHSAQESQENRNVICAFNQHFKCSLLKRCGKCGGRPFCVSSDSSVARQMEPFLFIYFWNQSVDKPALFLKPWTPPFLFILGNQSELHRKEGRIEGCRGVGEYTEEPLIVSKRINWKLGAWGT